MRWPSGKVSALGTEGSRFETRFHRRSAVYWAYSKLTQGLGDQTSSRWCDGEAWNGVPAQVSSSSSDQSSKLRGPSQNNPRVA
ncbi:hypothetical protein AVEN_224099-1 [Araneus ventricosus]|uniref:Uncharacterized protein n=1 Tax=Araneus ventricosus TaxID=182803 RepID=A0A4Y2DYG9_ARAVE|nr:hypothetical protein AVEN_224099-1 [Araneus ventricosus]